MTGILTAAVVAEDDELALGSLVLCWGGSYRISLEGTDVTEWAAYRLDGTGSRIAAQDPAGLEAALRADLAHLEAARITPPAPWTEQEEILLLAAYRAEHRNLSVRMLSPDGPWQAVITEDDGETTVTRYTRGALLRKLGEVIGKPGSAMHASG